MEQLCQCLTRMPSSTADAVSGTYYVEDRGRHFYDMVSRGSPRGSGGQPTERTRRGKQMDRLKHTELPALESLEELLARTRIIPELDTQRQNEAPLKLPPIRMEIQDHLHQRTADFHEWLRHPKAQPRRPSADEAERPPLSWHLLLLRASYNDSSLKATTVADWLAEVLDLPSEIATKHAQAAMTRPAVHLATFPAWSEVTEKADSLRALGLAVQVGSAGMHRAIVSNRRGKIGGPVPKESYMDLFTGLALASRKAKKRRIKRPPGSRSQDHRKVWRGISQKVVVNVLSKDPVQELFKEESGEAFGPTDSESQAERSQWDAATLRRRQLKKLLQRSKMVMVQAHEREPESQPVSKTPSSRPDAMSRSASKSQIERAVRLNPHRREACQMMRFFVFGLAGLSNKRETLTTDSIGTRAQVEMLCKMWLKLDNDHSGRCDFSEFRPFAETRMTDLAKGLLAAQPEGGVLDGVPEWAAMNSEEDVPRVVSRFLKTLEQVLLGVKSSFVLEDMMRVLWPAAQITSLAEMRRWGTELSASLDRRIVTTPPLLPEAQLEDLQCVFKYFDVDHDGELKASEILASGLLNPSEVDLLMEQYDVDGDGTLGVLEFCEMLCPHGYRAHDKATRANLQDGTQVFYDPTIQSWQMQSE